MRKLLPVLLLVIHCKTPDGVYRQTPPPKNGEPTEFQIVEYGGFTFAQSNSPERLVQVENFGELEVFKSVGADGEERKGESEAFPNLELKGEQIRIVSAAAGKGEVYQKDPQRKQIFMNLKQRLSFVPIGRAQKGDFQRADLRGPFLLATSAKGECQRFVLFALPPGEKGDEKLNLRATHGRGNFPQDCYSELRNGYTYDVSDNAFGMVLIPDDGGKIVGMIVIGYMYARPYIADGYPPAKAMQFMKKGMGAAEKVYE